MRSGAVERIGMKVAFALAAWPLVLVAGCDIAEPDEAEGVSMTTSAVSVLVSPTYTFVGMVHWCGDAAPDVIAREDATNIIYCIPGQIGGGPILFPRQQLFTGQGNRTFAGAIDWNKDGFADIVYRDDTNATLNVLDHFGGVSGIGTNWAGYTLAGVGDWTRDGNEDVVARENSNGNLWAYAGSGTYATLSTRHSMGGGFNGVTFAGVANYDSNAGINPDFIWRDDIAGANFANLYVSRGRGSSNFVPFTAQQIGNGWSNYTFAGLADWNSDGYVDIIARQNTTFDLLLYSGTGNVAYPTGPTTIGIGF